MNPSNFHQLNSLSSGRLANAPLSSCNVNVPLPSRDRPGGAGWVAPDLQSSTSARMFPSDVPVHAPRSGPAGPATAVTSGSTFMMEAHARQHALSPPSFSSVSSNFGASLVTFPSEACSASDVAHALSSPSSSFTSAPISAASVLASGQDALLGANGISGSVGSGGSGASVRGRGGVRTRGRSKPNCKPPGARSRSAVGDASISGSGASGQSAASGAVGYEVGAGGSPEGAPRSKGGAGAGSTRSATGNFSSGYGHGCLLPEAVDSAVSAVCGAGGSAAELGSVSAAQKAKGVHANAKSDRRSKGGASATKQSPSRAGAGTGARGTAEKGAKVKSSKDGNEIKDKAKMLARSRGHASGAAKKSSYQPLKPLKPRIETKDYKQKLSQALGQLRRFSRCCVDPALCSPRLDCSHGLVLCVCSVALWRFVCASQVRESGKRTTGWYWIDSLRPSSRNPNLISSCDVCWVLSIVCIVEAFGRSVVSLLFSVVSFFFPFVFFFSC